MNRRLGLPAVLAIVVLTVLSLFVATRMIQNSDDAPPGSASATPAAAVCEPLSDPYGSPPNSFVYAKVDEETRQKTIKALNLDDAGGRVDMRAARQGELTLGTLVGVPSRDPAGYVTGLVETAEKGGSPVSKQRGFTLIPLQSGTVVAVGSKGCTAILISAQDPNAVQFLATAVFNE